MRTSVAAMAVIARVTPAGETAWLTQWNAKWGRLNLVGGHTRPGESFRDCCAREVAEELGLADGRDFRVTPEPLARVEYAGHSASAGEETRYTFELFRVELLSPAVVEAVTAGDGNRWVTDAEVVAGQSVTRQPVSPTTFRLLTEAGLLTPAAGGRPSDRLVT